MTSSKKIWYRSRWRPFVLAAFSGTAFVAASISWLSFFGEGNPSQVAYDSVVTDGAHTTIDETSAWGHYGVRNDTQGNSNPSLKRYSGNLDLPWSIAGLLQSGDAAYLQSATPDDIAPARVRQAISLAASTDVIPPEAFSQLLQWLGSQQTIASRSLLISLAAAREHKADHALALSVATNALDAARNSGEYEALLLSVLQMPRLPFELIEQFRREAQKSANLGTSIAASISEMQTKAHLESAAGHITSYIDQGTSLRNSIEIVPAQSLIETMAKAHTTVQHSVILDVLATSPRPDAIDVFILLSGQDRVVNPSALAAAATAYGHSQLSGDRITRLLEFECSSNLNAQQRQLLMLMRKASTEAGSMQEDSTLGGQCGASKPA